MAEIQANDHGSDGKKNKQKKQTLRVDFTPMVDMNMLLITFFMFCTTLLKPQTMNLNMPTKDEVKEEEKQQVKESGAITFLLGADNQLFYYEGMPKDEKTGVDHYDDPDFLQVSSYDAESGLRPYLLKRNEDTYEKIQELKVQLQKQEIPDSIFRQKSKEVYDEAKNNPNIVVPTVIIKPTDFATYKNMVDVLDEMLVTNIGAYAIIDLQDGDRYLLYKKTDDPQYLSDEQRAQGIDKGKK
ncbi:MAG: biopolymer transporter ExbD [Dysgonamonadaceae bacterium]|jgi:biopolymer transport protein ExbD|nr:biopolymer transporter ExbD [Dysgonamonadaceae bacterium]